MKNNHNRPRIILVFYMFFWANNERLTMSTLSWTSVLNMVARALGERNSGEPCGLCRQLQQSRHHFLVLWTAWRLPIPVIVHLNEEVPSLWFLFLHHLEIYVPSGKHTKNIRKSPCSSSQTVSLPEGFFVCWIWFAKKISAPRSIFLGLELLPGGQWSYVMVLGICGTSTAGDSPTDRIYSLVIPHRLWNISHLGKL